MMWVLGLWALVIGVVFLRVYLQFTQQQKKIGQKVSRHGPS